MELIFWLLVMLQWVLTYCWYVFVALGAIWLLYYIITGITFRVRSIGEVKQKVHIKTEFYESVIRQYGLPRNSENPNIDIRLTEALSYVIQHMSCDNSVISSFDKVLEKFNNNYVLSSATLSTDPLNSRIYTINGVSIKIYKEGWPKVNTRVTAFCLKCKYVSLYFYPYFCIVERKDKIALIEWKDIKVSSTKGEPSTHYLHERVDGGPDRRYKYNPIIPIYIYSALVFHIAGNSINLILQGEKEAEKFEKLFREYKKVLASTGGVYLS